MLQLSLQPGPSGPRTSALVSDALVSDITDLQNTFGKAVASGQHFVAWMVEYDLRGLVRQLVALVGPAKAQLLLDG